MRPQILRLPEVKQETGLGRSTIYALIAEGKFPKQVKLTGKRAVGWQAEDISEWIKSRNQAA